MTSAYPAYFEIHVEEPSRAIKFYSALFGWSFAAVKGLPVAYWRIETSGMSGGLLARPARASGAPGVNAFVCSMEVRDFDASAERIVQLGGSIAVAKFPVPGKCWQGYFLDPEGNTFGIFEVDLEARRG